MRVQDTIHKGKTWPLFRAPMLQLEALWKGPAKPFGCAYTCAIGDTVTQGESPYSAMPCTPLSLAGRLAGWEPAELASVVV